MPLPAAVRIVLVETSHPGNVGACARAMKNMGLRELLLVKPHSFPDPRAALRAGGAADLVEGARSCATVEEAIAGCGLVLGATARARSANWRVLDARQAARELASVPRSRPAALLFGGERNGLANHDLVRCHALVRIPSAAEYPSLNLAQAVQVLCYELYLAQGAPGRADWEAPRELASVGDLADFHAHLQRVMRRCGFLRDDNARQLALRMERLFARAMPDDGELRILRGWLAATERGLEAQERRQ